MNVLDLFSGIGGFSLGLHRAGMKTVAFCEIEPFPQAVLRKNFPGVPIYDDVRTLTAERLRADGIDTIDVICGGFPCQPFSVAGKQRGADDHRHLWPEMFRLIQEIRPTWVIGENVAGFVSMALCEVSADLESAGYEVQPFIIPACAADAPHRRDRVWIIANSYGDDGNTRRAEPEGQQREARAANGSGKILANAGCQGVYERRQFANVEGEGFRPGRVGGDGVSEGVFSEGKALANSAQLFGHVGDSKPPCGVSESRDDCGESGKYQLWPTEPPVGRVANGIPRTLDIGRLIRYIENTNNITEVANGRQSKGCMEKKASENDTAYKMRILREYCESAKASRRLDSARMGADTLPEVSCPHGLHAREMGAGQEGKTRMCDMQDNVSSEGQPYTQNVQCGLPLCVRKAERYEAVGQRADRLKGLGNAVVPQIPEIIGRAIVAIDGSR